MNILIIGAEELLGQKIIEGFQKSHIHEVYALLSDQHLVPVIRQLDAEPIIGSPADHLMDTLKMIDAVIYTSMQETTAKDQLIDTDYDGILKLIQTCRNEGLKRFILLNPLNSAQPEAAPEHEQHQLFIRNRIEDYLKKSGLNYTIIRSGKPIANQKGINRILASIQQQQDLDPSISMDDLAKVLVESLTADTTYNKEFYVTSGPFPVAEALYDL